MENKKKLTLLTGAAWMVFWSSVIQAGEFSRVFEVKGSDLTIDGSTDEVGSKKSAEKSCGGDKGCHGKNELPAPHKGKKANLPQ